MRKKNLSINEEREQIILKVYLTKTDVRDFLHCGSTYAKKVFNECAQMCIDDGKRNLNGKIYYKYLLVYAGLKESDIHRMAKIERQIKKDTLSPTKVVECQS